MKEKSSADSPAGRESADARRTECLEALRGAQRALFEWYASTEITEDNAAQVIAADRVCIDTIEQLTKAQQVVQAREGERRR
jgi:hypothetical protein